MSNYSGYVEHSDFYIVPQSYQDAFDIGKAVDNGYDFDLVDKEMFVWNKYKGEWVQYDHR